ncbi:DUF4167 domain-containing protein [Devosia neptuniae]|uniref:DUF4167 domain-containing protein n=1 Tax=Devosia neptuniae TaxID=191302 RepID=A0ABY6CHL1_9HYPH|nr:DUF4167 domain-containing protein [Devosia neptuniae]UXN71716.1 DUF4167 domain-containing protein [Devosia neptuniae]
MRPNNQNKNRQRSRNGGRKHVNPLSRNFESNGPDVKVRGNAAHIAEKYLQLARDAQSSGDSVMAENYLQHAEHYFRIVTAAQQAQSGQRPDGQSQDDDFDDDMPEMNSRFASPQPIQQPSQQGDGDEQGEGDRAEQPQQQQQGERNNDRGDRQRRDRQERPRQERPRQERPEQQEQPQIAAVAAEPVVESDTEAAAEQQAEGEARKPRRPRRRRPAGGDAGDPAGAPQPDVGELPAFLTGGKTATAAE